LRLSEWLNWYDRIAAELGIEPSKDLAAAELLASTICGRAITPTSLAERLARFKAVVVFGAGPSLLRDVETSRELLSRSDIGVVAADGACTPLIREGVLPSVVVTDLDGPEDDLRACSTNGSVMVVHAHGDNVEALRRVLPQISGQVMGTTQTAPVGCLQNFGGFTDGDRAVLMCEALGCKRIVLGGMDFGCEVGEYSKRLPLAQPALERKLKKLEIGRRILEWLPNHSDAELYDATTLSAGLQGFRKISWRELCDVLER